MPYSEFHLLCNELQIVLSAIELEDKELAKDAIRRARTIILKLAMENKIYEGGKWKDQKESFKKKK